MDRAYVPSLNPPPGLIWNRNIDLRLEAYTQLAYSDNSAARAQAYRRIDEDLSSVDAMCLSLRFRRNRLMPVNRLPPELLSTIFRLLAKIWPPQSDGSLGWIPVTHVCQQWRVVACQDSALWAAAIVNFPFSEHWSLEIMRRVKSLPFCFLFKRFSPPRIKLPFAMSLLKYHLHHVKDLFVQISPDSMASLLPILSSAATCLETITLKTDCNNFNFFLPLDALCSHAPALRIVDLTEISISCDSRVFSSSSLEELIVSVLDESDTSLITAPLDNFCRPSAIAFTSILSGLPGLKKLRLINSSPLSTAGSLSLTSAHLPKLSFLYIKGTIAECVGILEALRLPPDCTLKITCYVQLSEDARHLTPIFVRASTHLRRDSHLAPITNFSVYAEDEHTICLSGWRDPRKATLPVDATGDDAAFAICLHFECDINATLRNISDLWDIVHAKLPLQETTYLYVVVTEFFAHDVPHGEWVWKWVDQLAPFTTLTYCDIDNLLPGHSLELFSALGRPTVNGQPLFLLPSLVSLRIKSAHQPPYDDDWTYTWPQYGNSLVKVLKQRKENGTAIKKLVLRNWEIDAECEGQLRLIVPELVLDGPGLSESDGDECMDES